MYLQVWQLPRAFLQFLINCSPTGVTSEDTKILYQSCYWSSNRFMVSKALTPLLPKPRPQSALNSWRKYQNTQQNNSLKMLTILHMDDDSDGDTNNVDVEFKKRLKSINVNLTINERSNYRTLMPERLL